jgi:hypothetical protein
MVSYLALEWIRNQAEEDIGAALGLAIAGLRVGGLTWEKFVNRSRGHVGL